MIFPSRAKEAAILVFARGPRQDGWRKPLGADAAACVDAAAMMLQQTLASARATGAEVLLAGDAELERTADPDVTFLRQRGTSFRDRLRNAVADGFRLGYRRVVVVGADTPALTSCVCLDALAQLRRGGSRAVVIGPSRDGGYYLIGFNRFDERAFAGIPFCTGRVLAHTMRALAGCRLYRLPILTDADDAGSLRRALREARCDRRSALARLIERLADVVVRHHSSFLPRLASFLVPVRRGPPVFA